MVPRPTWDPIPEPPGPDPATLQDFQVLAGESMPELEYFGDAVRWTTWAIYLQADAAEAATDALGRDLAAGAEELTSMQAEASADSLEGELLAAAGQDAALAAVAADVGATLGEPSAAPAPAPTAPPATPEAPAAPVAPVSPPPAPAPYIWEVPEPGLPFGGLPYP